MENVSKGKAVTSSTPAYLDNTPDKVVDGLANTGFLANNANVEVLLLIDLLEESSVDEVELINLNFSNVYRTKDFDLEYSNNNTTFNQIISSTLLANTTPQKFTFNSRINARYWRLRIKNNHGGAGWSHGIAEISLFKNVVNKFLISSGEKTYSYKGFGVNMTNYFTFDEPSGNVNDSKGSTVGTISGGVTRVTGYKDEGSALSFNGTNGYVQFDKKVIPVGKKSIRFKIKTNQKTTGYVIADIQVGANGYYFTINSSGLFEVQFYYNGTAYKIAHNISDGLWHDILVLYDGAKLKLFVDDMNKQKGEVAYFETAWTSNYVFLGKSETTHYFNGQLDELEIYNEVIEPHNKLIDLSNIDTVNRFVEYGLENGDFIDLKSNIGGVKYCTDQSESLGGGKVFKVKLDTSKYPLKSVTVT